MTSSNSRLPKGVTIRKELRPGDIGYLIYLHGVLYAKEYGWDYTFDGYVAGPMADFAKSHTYREQLWVVEKDESIAGSIAIVESSREKAHLRWLLLHPSLRGLGIGNVLMEKAIMFCKECDYTSIFLWTVSELKAAAYIYNSFGFRLKEEKTLALWGSVVTEQRFDIEL